jgi:hypothetical protein
MEWPDNWWPPVVLSSIEVVSLASYITYMSLDLLIAFIYCMFSDKTPASNKALVLVYCFCFQFVH